MPRQETDRDQKKRLRIAEKRLRDMEKTIAPFVRKREILSETTQGQWIDSSSLSRSLLGTEEQSTCKTS